MKRLTLLGVLFYILAGQAWGATYYVDTTCTDTNAASGTVDGTAYDPATPACTGGAASYYVSVADVNAAVGTIAPGDTISFRKGQVWYDDLIVPEGGTAGNIDTYTSHGTGANPVISGGDVVSGWTAEGDSGAYYPAANADDVRDYATTLDDSSDLYFGRNAGDNTDFDMGIRFVSVTVPKDATISNSFLLATADGSDSGSATADIYGEDADDSATFSTHADFAARVAAQTTAKVDWTADAWAVGYYYLTADIATIITEITARAGWVSGNDLAILIENDTTTADHYRKFSPYNDTSGNYKTELRIGWDDAVSPTVWKATLATEPEVVLYNGEYLYERNGLLTAVGTNEWDWDTNVLYVNVGGEPTAGSIIAEQRDYSILIYYDYVTIDGIDVKNGYSGITIRNTADIAPDHVEIKNCNITKTYYWGIWVDDNGDGDPLITDISIHDNIIETGTDSMYYAFAGIQSEASDVQMYKNDISESTIGIVLSYNTASGGDPVIYGNTVYDIAKPQESERRIDSTVDLHGIDVGGSGTGVDNALIYRNKIYDTRKGSIILDTSEGTYVYYNILYNTIANLTTGNHAGIQVTDSSLNCFLENNTIYNTMNGIMGYSLSTGTTVKNNIISECDIYGINFVAGAEPTAADYNLVYNSGTANYLAPSAAGANDVNSDPLFISAGIDFRLNVSSPAINTGYTLGAAYDDALMPTRIAPPYTTGDQDDYGAWEIGAYTYPTTNGIVTGTVRDWTGAAITGVAVDIACYPLTGTGDDTRSDLVGPTSIGQSVSATGAYTVTGLTAGTEYFCTFCYYGSYGGTSKIAGGEFLTAY